jgi:hypothetical protein
MNRGPGRSLAPLAGVILRTETQKKAPWIVGWFKKIGLIKKGPDDRFAAITEADQPGMGMTNQVCPLREKSGERLLARQIRWGSSAEVPARDSKNQRAQLHGL